MTGVALERVACARCGDALFVTEYTAGLGGDWRHPDCLAALHREK